MANGRQIMAAIDDLEVRWQRLNTRAVNGEARVGQLTKERNEAVGLLVEILKMQRARYGDGMRTHLALMDFADKIEDLLTRNNT